MSDNATALSQKIADFIVKAEFDQQSIGQKDSGIYTHLHKKSQEIHQQLQSLSAEIGHLKHVMSHTGAQQWRQATEKLLNDIAAETTAVKNLYYQTRDTIAAQCESLNRSSMTTIKNVAQLMTSVKHANLEKLTTEKTVELQDECEKSLSGVGRVVRSFHWKNLGMAILLSVVVSTIVSLYINDVWPWQAHEEVVKQREVGKVLMTSWKQLSQNDREMINQNV